MKAFLVTVSTLCVWHFALFLGVCNGQFSLFSESLRHQKANTGAKSRYGNIFS